MKIRALAIISALALPALAIADTKAPTDTPPAAASPGPSKPGTATDPSRPDPGKPDPSRPDATSPSPGTTPAQPGMPADSSKADTGNTNDQSKSGGKLSDADTRVVAHLHHVNQMEIEVGKLAQKQGTASVKNYGSSLVTDHQSADKDLTSFAKTHKLATIPADKPQTDADKQDQKDMQSKMANLKNLKGADFDREFLNMMAMGHDKELANIDAAIGSATDPDLQTLLKGVKPVLQRHADQARDLQKNAPQASAGPAPAPSGTPTTNQAPPSQPSPTSPPTPPATNKPLR